MPSRSSNIWVILVYVVRGPKYKLNGLTPAACPPNPLNEVMRVSVSGENPLRNVITSYIDLSCVESSCNSQGPGPYATEDKGPRSLEASSYLRLSEVIYTYCCTSLLKWTDIHNVSLAVI